MWVKERLNALVIVATLIATISFQAVTNPPGGVFQEDSTIYANEDPVRFIYYLRNAMNHPTMSPGFQYLHDYVDNLPSHSTKGGINAAEIISYTANFINDLLTAATSNDSYTSSVYPYMRRSHKLGTGIVFEDWWMNLNFQLQ